VHSNEAGKRHADPQTKCNQSCGRPAISALWPLGPRAGEVDLVRNGLPIETPFRIKDAQTPKETFSDLLEARN
jgi:hypothetical protein